LKKCLLFIFVYIPSLLKKPTMVLVTRFCHNIIIIIYKFNKYLVVV